MTSELNHEDLAARVSRLINAGTVTEVRQRVDTCELGTAHMLGVTVYVPSEGKAAEDVIKARKAEVALAITDLQDKCHKASKGAGWWNCPISGEGYLDNPSLALLAIPTKLMLTVSEVAEAMEGDRRSLMDDKLPHRTAIETELADVIIRVLDLAGALELDVAGAIMEKMDFNAVRPDHKMTNRRELNGKKY